MKVIEMLLEVSVYVLGSRVVRSLSQPSGAGGEGEDHYSGTQLPKSRDVESRTVEGW